jgi:ribose 5-phosphate isomerase B
MPAHDPFPESEVRAIVRRVVAGVLEPPSGAPAGGDAGGSSVGSVPAGSAGPIGATGSSRASGAIAVGSDHGGFELKEVIAARLRDAGHDVVDCGTYGPDAVDYPEFAHTVARRVADGSCRWGIVVDGAGIGSAMVANKVPGIRAALCYDLSSARNSREHNHANVLTLGAGLIGQGLAWQIVQEWLSVPWGPDRHARRVEMISDIERSYVGAGASSTGGQVGGQVADHAGGVRS